MLSPRQTLALPTPSSISGITQAISNIAWALATLELHPPPEFKSSMLAACSAAKLEQFNPQGLCNLIWGLAHIQPDLPAWWCDAFAQVGGLARMTI